jgi:Outer membrane lipoprotein carrier protein LolA-like
MGPRLRVPLLWGAMLLSGPAAAADAGWGAGALLASLAGTARGEVHFTEEKYLAVLDVPLLQSGILRFTPPSRLEEHILTPFDQRYLIDGDRLTVESSTLGSGSRFSLHDHPVVWAFVESFRATLSGNLPLLRRFYEVHLEGRPMAWKLTLLPRLAEMARMVSAIEIAGSGDRVATVTLRQRNGDHSVLSIEAHGR